MKKRTISLGAFFSVILLVFLALLLIEGGVTIYSRISNSLQEFSTRGDVFIKVSGHLLREQVRRGEAFIDDLARGKIAPDLNDRVVLAAVMDGDKIHSVLKGWLPVGMVLPREVLKKGWRMNDLLDMSGRNLLSTVMRVGDMEVFAALDLDMDELNVGGSPDLLTILSTPDGVLIWGGAEESDSGLGEHVRARGLMSIKPYGERQWAFHYSLSGYWLAMRQESFPYGLLLTLAYPLPNLLVSALGDAAAASATTGAAVIMILLIWFVWWRGIYGGIREIASLSNNMTVQLEALDGANYIAAAEVMHSMAEGFANLKSSFVSESNAFTANLKKLFQVISHQQEELTAFNEEMEAINQELENSNNRLVMRENLWERTLEFSRAFARGEDGRQAVASTLVTIKRDVGAFGVLVSAVEGDCYRYYASCGYDGELAPFLVKRDGIAATESMISGAPLWVEDVTKHPTAWPVHPKVKSELLIPLYQSGEEEGVLEIAFDAVTQSDPLLVETLAPVASYLGGLIHGGKMRREVEKSYAYLAEKLQFVTGIYHDETENHIARVGEYCRLLAEETGRSLAEQDGIALFARLHDIGKLKVPHHILCKPGPLTAEEFAVITNHPVWGAEILGEASWLTMARNICLTHHEKWDGSGYPYGLKGDEIPWEGQVAAVGDIYDALRSSRAYKPPFSHERAMEIFTKGDGRVEPGHFSPQILDAFVRRSGDLEEIFESLRDDPPS